MIQFQTGLNRNMKLGHVRVQTSQLSKGTGALLALELALGFSHVQVVDPHDVSSQIAWRHEPDRLRQKQDRLRHEQDINFVTQFK